MLNNFYNSVKLIHDRVSSNPLVNTIIFARTEDKDLYKRNIFPICHINPITSPWINSQVNQFTFEVGVFEQRDINKVDTNTKFEGNDNLIDNMNTCYAVLNDLLTYLSIQNNEYNIELTSVSNIQPLIFQDFNLLDGWVMTLTLTAPNDIISVC
jgi:hypothetical protein